jgi:Methyltransferase domain
VTAPHAPATKATLVLRLRASRRNARDAATAEVCSLLREAGARPGRGGPLSEERGAAWVELEEEFVPALPSAVDRLGYTERVDLVRPAGSAPVGPDATPVRWKGHTVFLVPVYSEPDGELRAFDPDRRSFLLECGDGVVRRIEGYRGGRGPMEHRALPVVDARLLVNLVASFSRGRLLDPFAGAGGIVVEARASGWTVASVDVDPALRHGLAELADEHTVGDARSLPFPTASVDAVATEPPYHPSALETVVASIPEIARVLRPGARAAMLAGAAHREAIASAAAAAGLRLELETAIDRKGTDVAAFAWIRR